MPVRWCFENKKTLSFSYTRERNYSNRFEFSFLPPHFDGTLFTFHYAIVSRGGLVMKPGKLQRNNSLLWFLRRHVITTLHTDKQNGVSTVIKP